MSDNRHDPGYRIHTFQGRELIKKAINTLIRFKWRPRPPVNLPEQQLKEIRRNIKKISQEFEDEDRREQLQLSKELTQKRQEIMNKFNQLRVEHRRRREIEKEDRIKLRSMTFSLIIVT